MVHTEHAEVIVVGAGIGGLAAAKTYLELSPGTSLLLIEKRPTLGGVWAEENCYEGLKTNNLGGTYEFSDFPMGEKYGVKEDGHISGYTLHRYLNDFADHFDLRRRMHFNTRILQAEKLDSGWRLYAESTTGGKGSGPLRYTCYKLIVSSGLSSTPNPVNIDGKEDFNRPIIDHTQLRSEGARIAQNPAVKSVTVVGASKTGYDVVHLMASNGKKVDWIIRESGGGGVWMASPWVPFAGAITKLELLATMRYFTWFSPCVWGGFDGFSWIRKLLHQTRIGRCLFWSARVGILNYPSDIHDYLRSGQVKITIKDIDHLSAPGLVTFSDGTSIQTDALVAITGWKLGSTLEYKPDGLDAQLGIPSSYSDTKENAFWEQLDSEADKEILGRFPYLRNPPSRIPYKQNVTPFRLYRGIAPPSLTTLGDYSLAYMKMVHSTSNVIIAETQALWVYAYLNGKLRIDAADVYRQTALMSRYGKHRYPCGFSEWYPEFVYDAIPYADMLLSDLGVRSWRKPTWRREMFEGYTIHDYRGINREWASRG
ncbi:predicted protein [Aspergillus terreus NIH2624]|uniref:FAD/NAD(P)-binding domain-containing protein n=1 Tax=Aspergillus terreus (strain NIH 2624 / FGSC A1156) TaxID=341663 RepID=Q0CUD8_ASPTN|nr:uncharacterized protein ATEG_02696 [Aspergillus terreus NIH2624]EAU37658.1 predicted protein [Aspergillus terreus NIH2624]